MREYAKKDCLWLRLSEQDKPVVLYGTGNGADKILDVCIKYNIKISGVFASSGFVRDREFRGMKVESLEMLEDRLGDFVVLLCFGTTRDEVVESIRSVAEKHTLYIPDVPLYGGEVFDWDYYEANKVNLEKAWEMLEDDFSKEVFDDIVSFRLSGEGKYLAKTEAACDSYKSILAKGRKYDCVIDCGAFTGDSAHDLCKALSPKCIIAAEPDSRSFKKLSAFAENSGCNIIPINAAIGKSVGQTEFSQGGSRSSGTGTIAKRAKSAMVEITTVDTLSNNVNISVDAVKYDVEGDEADAIIGSIETIKKYSPALAVSVYHRTSDLFSLMFKIHEINPDYRFYMRRVPCIPAWDIILFAII